MNASFHYDTSNDVFSGFLSQDMNYSSAIWSGESNESLESAQRRKVHNIIDKARISSSHHVLDIGCGWGNLAIEAVKRTGCRVTGLTLSAEQRELAQKRIKAAGLEGQITILLCDYRQAPKPDGGYDRIVSVEMLEHVGDKYMIQYFESISSLLKRDSGIMVIQGITMINPVSALQTCISFPDGIVTIFALAHNLMLDRFTASCPMWVDFWIATSSLEDICLLSINFSCRFMLGHEAHLRWKLFRA
jgi:cyclopropane-fatty-acyl-phospholipid synthase